MVIRVAVFSLTIGTLIKMKHVGAASRVPTRIMKVAG